MVSLLFILPEMVPVASDEAGSLHQAYNPELKTSAPHSSSPGPQYTIIRHGNDHREQPKGEHRKINDDDSSKMSHVDLLNRDQGAIAENTDEDRHHGTKPYLNSKHSTNCLTLKCNMSFAHNNVTDVVNIRYCMIRAVYFDLLINVVLLQINAHKICLLSFHSEIVSFNYFGELFLGERSFAHVCLHLPVPSRNPAYC